MTPVLKTPVRRGQYQATVTLMSRPNPGLLDVLRDPYKANNTFTVGLPVAPRSYDVTITLRHVDIRDQCDNASPGDWKMVAFKRRNGEIVRTEGWPHGSRSQNVETGDRWRSNRTFRFRNLRANERFGVSIRGFDCDGTAIVINPSRFRQACHGEEIWEQSGSTDFTGRIEIDETATSIRPGQWRQNATGGDCRKPAYIGSFTVERKVIW